MLLFILKVFALSAGIAVAIKYGGPYLPVSGTVPVALIAVLSPTILLAIALAWRWQEGKGEG